MKFIKKEENKNAKGCEKIKTKYHYYLIYICCVMYEIGLYAVRKFCTKCR